MNLLLLTFGDRLENHHQASFAILTFLKDPLIRNIVIVTDRPEFYRLFQTRVEIFVVDKTILQEWQGQYQFFWRVKMKALEAVQNRYPDQHLLYVDSDTFLATNLQEIYQGLNEGKAFMHCFEGFLSKKGSKTFNKMHSSLNQRTFNNILLQSNSEMWNAGVIALPKSKAKELIQQSIKTCDEICASNCPRRLVEQFAFSVTLKHYTNLTSCENIIGHYWGNKEEWNKFITDFFVNAHLKQYSLEETIESIHSIDWLVLPLEKQKRNTAEKLKRIIDKLFKIHQVRYFIKK